MYRREFLLPNFTTFALFFSLFIFSLSEILEITVDMMLRYPENMSRYFLKNEDIFLYKDNTSLTKSGS